MPASRSASRPAPIASLRDRVQGLVAICVDAELLDDVEGAVAAGQLDDVGLAVDGLEDGVARSLFTSRVMCLSAIACRTWRGMTSMNCCPPRMRATFSSSNTRSVPGRPSAAPVMTTGSLRAGAELPEPGGRS